MIMFSLSLNGIEPIFPGYEPGILPLNYSDVANARIELAQA